MKRVTLKRASPHGAAARGDSLRAPRGELNSDPVTRSLRDDTDPLRGKSAQNRGRLKPIYDQEQPPPRRTTHKVRPGDTLYSIARSHGIDADILARANRLSDPNLIRVGDTLYIPEDGTIDQRRGSDRRRAVRRDPGSADPRQARRDRRYVERSAPRYSDDALYTDPLLRERQDRADRRRAAPRRSRR